MILSSSSPKAVARHYHTAYPLSRYLSVDSDHQQLRNSFDTLAQSRSSIMSKSIFTKEYSADRVVLVHDSQTQDGRNEVVRNEVDLPDDTSLGSRLNYKH